MLEEEAAVSDRYKIHIQEIKEEDLESMWNYGKEVGDITTIKYLDNISQPIVLKKMKSLKDFEGHIAFYKEIIKREIRSPEMISVDKIHFMIAFQAVGIEKNGEKIWSKTLVNFKYNPEKEYDNIDFLVRSMEYALHNNWKDLHSGNILFEDGYLYLVDYVPGRGQHKIGSFGIQKIQLHEKANLKKENFGSLLKKALEMVNSDLVDTSGLIALREDI